MKIIRWLILFLTSYVLITIRPASAYPLRVLPNAGPRDVREDHSGPRGVKSSPAGLPGALEALNGTTLGGHRRARRLPRFRRHPHIGNTAIVRKRRRNGRGRISGSNNLQLSSNIRSTSVFGSAPPVNEEPVEYGASPLQLTNGTDLSDENVGWTPVSFSASEENIRLELNDQFHLVRLQDSFSNAPGLSGQEVSVGRDKYDNGTRSTRSANGTKFYEVFSQSFLLFSASGGCVVVINPEGTVSTAPRSPSGTCTSYTSTYLIT